MKPHKILLPFLATCCFAAYQYYYSDDLTSINPSNWFQNGSVTATSEGLTAPGTNGGSLISTIPIPDGTNEYEVKTKLHLTTSGGTYVQYLRASSDALSGPSPSGSYVAVEIQNPTWNGYRYDATLAVYKRSGGQITLLGSRSVFVRNRSTVRTVLIWGSSLIVYLDGKFWSWTPGIDVSGVMPGVGARATPAGNSISLVEFGPRDRTGPPVGVDPDTIGSSVFPNHVDLQWKGVVDDPDGVGIAHYDMYRDGELIGFQHPTEQAFSDPTVSPSTTYAYTIKYVDFHFNDSPLTEITIVTPPAGSVDPRQVGVRPTGSYWGAMGEQIDMLSGNVNFTLPLVKAQSRNGNSATFALNYNSQNWRKDDGGTWRLGRDVGYGFGWRLMAGAVTPYWSNVWTLHHYVYTDSTGAEYRLDVNDNGVWSSREGIYVWYDSNNDRLYFADGSFWEMDCISAGTEEDAGTRYPMLMQDSNGNQILVGYDHGMDVGWEHSSARIVTVEDVRAKEAVGQIIPTYNFHYENGHLFQIKSTILTGEWWAFDFTSSQALYSPFTPFEDFGTTSLLDAVRYIGPALEHGFEYGSNGAGELTKVILPYRGELRWDYRDFTYIGNRTLREVENRHLVTSSGATPLTYSIWHPPDDAGKTVHSEAAIFDPGGDALRLWGFESAPGVWNIGLTLYDHDRRNPDHYIYRMKYFTWSQTGAGDPYISTVGTTLDYVTPYQVYSRVEQTLDKHGIKYHITGIVPYIQQANREDMCPMEKLSLGKEAKEFYEVMRSIIKQEAGKAWRR